MPGQDGLLFQGDVILKPLTDIRKQRVENGFQCQHGGACIHWACDGGHGAHLATRACVPLKHRDVEPGMRKPQRGRQPADTGTNHSD